MATTKKAIAEAEQAAEIKETIAAPTTEPGTPAVTLDELESMDMNMFDAEETESAPRPAWRITDDGCADWACRKIAEEKTELDRITALAKARSRRSSRELTLLSADMKTAPVFSLKARGILRDSPAQDNQDKTQLPPSLRHSGEENRRQHHETGRRHTAGLSESLRQ